jgi:hypothetical protein
MRWFKPGVYLLTPHNENGKATIEMPNATRDVVAPVTVLNAHDEPPVPAVWLSSAPMLTMVPFLPFPLLSAHTLDDGYAEETSYHDVRPAVTGMKLYSGGLGGLGGLGGSAQDCRYCTTTLPTP